MTSIDNVTDVSPRVQYTAAAAQTDFDYAFPIFAGADLTVDVDGVTKTLTTDYTVSGAGNDTGGTVTFVTAPGDGAVVTIYRDIAIARSTDIQQNGPLSSTTWNDEQDKVFLILQELENKIGRAIRFPITSASTNAQAEMAPISNFFGKFLRITSAGILEAAEALDNTVSLTAEVIGALINPQTAAELAAGVTPVFYVNKAGVPERYVANATPGTTDMTAAFQACADIADTHPMEAGPGPYRIDGVINCTLDDAVYNFNGTKIVAEDDGTFGTLSNLATGPIVFHFKGCDNIHVTGSVFIQGQGTPTTTRLAGMVFDDCQDVNAPYLYQCDNMALGRQVWHCSYSKFGDIVADRMYGTQTYSGSGTAGTAEGIIGCTYCEFGEITSKNNYKPVRYFSTGANGASAHVDNDYITCGAITASAFAGSQESSVLTLRSAKNVAHGPVIGSGFRAGLLVNALSGDGALGYTIDNNVIESVICDAPGTAASLDSCIIQDAQSGESIGTTIVSSAICDSDGETAVYCNSGILTIGNCHILGGATRGVQVLDSDINFGTLVIEAVDKAPVEIGLGANFHADFIDVRAGWLTSQTAVITHTNSSGSGSSGKFGIGRIKYDDNGVGTDFTYVIIDTLNSFESWDVGAIEGTGSTAQARFGSDNFTRLQNGWASTAAPTTMTYTAGAEVKDITPTVDGNNMMTDGFRCTVGGTPGTWVTKYVSTVSPAT